MAAPVVLEHADDSTFPVSVHLCRSQLSASRCWVARNPKPLP